MDVIEAPKPTALDVSKRQPLIRRSVYVHEGVIARLETCERKLDSFRGSGLTYVLRSLNQYCHQLCPGKLLQALRILSDNQLFDRGTLYNLYTHIVKNILYFNSSQHRQLLQSISKCMAYTVQYSRVPSVEACSNLIAEINQLLPEEDMNTVSLQASKQAPTDNIANVVTNTETDNSIGGDMSHYANSVDISAFDGGPVPLSELNRLTSEIVSAVCSIYNWSNAQRRRIASLSDLGAIYSLCLDIYLRHSLTMDIKPRDILDIAYALSNHLAATFNDRLGWTTTTNASTALITDANVIADSMSWLLFDMLRNILSSSDSDTNCFSKQPIKLDILQQTKQLRDNYIHGNISSLHLVVSTFQCHRPGSQDGNHAQLWRLDTQNTINALRRLGHQINRICQVFLAHHEILPSFIRLLSLSCAFSAVLPLFDKNGQCITDNPNLLQNTTKTRDQRIGPMTLLSDVIHHIPQLDVKTTFNILSIVSYTNLESNDSFLLDIVRQCFYRLYTNCTSLSNTEILYTLELCWNRFDYIHHYGSRLMLNTALRRYASTTLDVLLATNLHMFAMKLPYNMVTSVEPKSFIRILDYVDTIQSDDRYYKSDVLEGVSKVQSPMLNGSGTTRSMTSVPKPHVSKCIASTYRHRRHSRPAVHRDISHWRQGSYLHRLWSSISPDRYRKVMSLLH